MLNQLRNYKRKTTNRRCDKPILSIKLTIDQFNRLNSLILSLGRFYKQD